METIQGRSPALGKSLISIRAPKAEDGADVWQLIGNSGALDTNSLYCNLLQCSDFADTCALATMNGETVGWMSGYIPPQHPDTLFVWQICVSPAARKRGLAQRLIQDVMQRKHCQKVRHIRCTITDDNAASWKLFGALARQLNAPLERREHFAKARHFKNMHDSEFEVVIGPFQPNVIRTLQAA